MSVMDLAWTAGIALTPAEVAFGRDLPCDVLGPQALEWQRYIRDYLRAMLPCLEQLFTIGFLGWTDQASPDSPMRFMGQGLVFEAVYRLTVHLCGAAKTLQSAPKGADAYHFQYRMLDDRENGICTEQVLDSLLEDLAASERPTAKPPSNLHSRPGMRWHTALSFGSLRTLWRGWGTCSSSQSSAW